MAAFRSGHAGDADWRRALSAAARQVDEGGPWSPTLGIAYFSDHYASEAGDLLAALQTQWPGVAWTGSVGVGVAASGIEHYDEPALALLLTDLPESQFQLFSGRRPLHEDSAYTALVHADPTTPDIGELIAELSERMESGYVFGGLASSRTETVHLADGVWRGGLSGVAFGREVALVSRVTQGCRPVGPVRLITAAERNVVQELDGRPALSVLLEDLEIDPEAPQAALPRVRATLAGLSAPSDQALARPGQFGDDTRVRHLIGLDPQRGAVAVAEQVQAGMQLAFCQRDREAARRDLVRICSEIRDELGPRGCAGAVYVSCAGRGGPHFGAPSAEAQIVRHALGDVPLVGFFAGGEIGHRHLYGYTGVLTAFAAEE